MRHACCLAALASLLSAGNAIAGGDYVLGRVTAFSGDGENFSFTFKQAASTSHRPLVRDCADIKVTVKYQRVPWFSRLPFVRSPHPSLVQTVSAGVFLRDAAHANREITFGYIGNGLVRGKEQCSFESKGIAVTDYAVVSFNGPV